LIDFSLRDNHWCVELNSISKTEVETKNEIKIETKTKSWMKSSSTIMSDSNELWFEMLRFVELRTLINKSTRFDWNETCLLLFTNNALFYSICVVLRFRDSVDFSWIFVFLILTILIRVVWARFVNLTICLLETRWVSMMKFLAWS
jgi:hypothetical protein